MQKLYGTMTFTFSPRAKGYELVWVSDRAGIQTTRTSQSNVQNVRS